MNDTKYQVMRPLTSEEYAGLKADIEKRGVQVPVIYDEEGFIIEGHNRVAICEELGITDFPKEVKTGLSEQEKRDLARALNVQRRQLSRTEKQEAVRDQLRETPEMSDRQIAKALGVDHKTVGAQRESLEGTGEIPQFNETVGADGKTRPRPERKEEVKQTRVSTASRQISPRYNGGGTSEYRALRNDLDEIARDMYDTEKKVEYGVEDLIDEIRINAEVYVKQLRRMFEIRSTVLVGENRKAVYNAVGMYVFDELEKVRKLLE